MNVNPEISSSLNWESESKPKKDNSNISIKPFPIPQQKAAASPDIKHKKVVIKTRSDVPKSVSASLNPMAKRFFNQVLAKTCQNPFLDIQQIDNLLKSGADPLAKDEKGFSAFDYVIGSQNEEAFLTFIDNTPNLKTLTSDDDPVLILACKHFSPKAVNILLDKEIEVDTKNQNKETALEITMKLNKKDLFLLLLERGAYPGISMGNGSQDSILCAAIKQGKLEYMKSLLEKGASPNLNYDGHTTPLTVALSTNNVEAAQLLLDYDADPKYKRPINHAIRSGNPELVDLILQYDIDLNEKDEKGNVSLKYGLDVNDWNIVENLLKHGANPNVRMKNGATLFSYACQKCHWNIPHLLLAHGAQILTLDRDYYTPYISYEKFRPITLPCKMSTRKELKQKDAGFSDWFLIQKLIAHRFGFSLKVNVLDQSNFELEGFHQSLSIAEINQSLENFSRGNEFKSQFNKSWDQKDLDSIYQIMAEAVSNVKNPPMINSNIFAFATFWVSNLFSQGHAISILIYDDILIKCNRGDGSEGHPGMQIFKIGNNNHQVMKETAELLCQTSETWEGKDFFTSGIDKKLNLQIIGSIAHKEQHSGNCSWASSKLLLKAVMLCKLLDKNTEAGKSASEQMEAHFEDVKKQSESFYRAWFNFDRMEAVKEVLKIFTHPPNDSLPDELRLQMKSVSKKCLLEVIGKCLTGKDSASKQAIFELILTELPSLAKMRPEFKNPHQNTLLHLAVLAKDASKIKRLVELGADPMETNNLGKTCYDLAGAELVPLLKK
jgi:ankyrin repeat protein